MSVGYVYVLSNQQMPGLVKIGFTTKDVKVRVAELSSATGVPAAFEIEYYCLTKNPEDVELQVHRHLSKHRLPNREFFSTDVFSAISAIETYLVNVEAEKFSRVPALSPRYLPPQYQCSSCGARNSSKICARCGKNWDD